MGEDAEESTVFAGTPQPYPSPTAESTADAPAFPPSPGPAPGGNGDLAALTARVEQLEREVAELRAALGE
jgi:hypothetical protein